MSSDCCPCRQSSCGGAKCRDQCGPGSRPAATSGILSINKPKDWTSHDVVARVRRLANQRRAGHAGTLDPMATGVLLVCLSQATRVSEYLMDLPKLYRASIRFGAATDTYDATGAIVAEISHVPSLSALEAELPRFIGRILQTPPAYSALKQRGEPAHRRARRGEEVEQLPRPVDIYTIRMLNWEPPVLQVDIECGKGTYIRSLAYDLGLATGSAAHLAELVRRAVGHFSVEQATPLPELETLVEQGMWERLLYPLDEALLRYPALVASTADVERIRNGQPIQATPAEERALRRIYSPEGNFVALVQGDSQSNQWRPHKVFQCG